MGCFSLFPCFSSSKHPKPNNNNKNKKSVTPTTSYSVVQGYDKVLIKLPTQESTNLESLHTPVPKSSFRDDSEGEVVNDSDKNNKTSVIEDSDVVDTNKDISAAEDVVEILAVGNIVNEKCEELEVVVQLDQISKESGNLGVVDETEKENDNKKKEMVPKQENQSRAVSDNSSVSSYISYPPMHRYHNHHVIQEEDSSESLFSLSVNPRRQSKSCLVEEDDDKEVNSPLKAGSSSPKMIAKSMENNTQGGIDSLLNPIENLAQWKTLNNKTIPPFLDLNQEKENFNLEQQQQDIMTIPVSQDPSFKDLDPNAAKVKNVATVTTSLSSWLVDPEKSMTTTVSKEESQYSTGNSYACSDGATSWKSFEDRPILGAWTMDEVKQISARSSPRKSPRRNPDETPIIGTVGSYWSHTKQGAYSSSSCTSPFGMSAKSRRTRESKALSCHSSPAKRRLERAFNKSAV